MTASTFPTQHPSGVPYGTLFDTECRQQLSISYAHAVATAARCSLEHIRVDYQTVDAVVRQSAEHLLNSTAQVDIQLKCTSKDSLRDEHVAFSLERKYYDKLRDTRRYEKIILVVLLVPARIEDWLVESEEHLQVHRAAYWMSLRGMPEISTDSTTLHVPRTQRFDVQQLLGILARIGSGETP